MDRCGCDDYASPIAPDIARDDRDAYHHDGPAEATAKLLAMIADAHGAKSTILDIGGGIGVIDLELLKAGSERAVLVEASQAYLDMARAEAQQAGLADRIEMVPGDFVRRADELEPADIVTLDRVFCCYPDAEALAALSGARARHLYGMILPRDRWYVRWLTRLENVGWWLRRDRYRAYAHPNELIDRQLAALGLRLEAEAFTGWWRVALFARTPGGESTVA